MLVLSRKPSQTIRIGEDIVLTVVKIQGNSVRVGIEAPKSVRVLRGELSDWHDFSFDAETPNEEKKAALIW